MYVKKCFNSCKRTFTTSLQRNLTNKQSHLQWQRSHSHQARSRKRKPSYCAKDIMNARVLLWVHLHCHYRTFGDTWNFIWAYLIRHRTCRLLCKRRKTCQWAHCVNSGAKREAKRSWLDYRGLIYRVYRVLYNSFKANCQDSLVKCNDWWIVTKEFWLRPLSTSCALVCVLTQNQHQQNTWKTMLGGFLSVSVTGISCSLKSKTSVTNELIIEPIKITDHYFTISTWNLSISFLNTCFAHVLGKMAYSNKLPSEVSE